MADSSLQLSSGFTGEGDGDDLGGQQALPGRHVGSFALWCPQCTKSGHGRARPRGREVRCALLGCKQVLYVAFSHDGGFPGSCARIKRNVAVKVETKALTVVEFNHQKSPPE